MAAQTTSLRRLLWRQQQHPAEIRGLRATLAAPLRTPKRLAHAFSDQHDLSLATMRVALDHDTCLEVAVLKGRTDEVERFAEQIVAERGVRHGRVVIIPAEIESERHAHGDRRPHVHQHIKVR